MLFLIILFLSYFFIDLVVSIMAISWFMLLTSININNSTLRIKQYDDLKIKTDFKFLNANNCMLYLFFLNVGF